ncbi:MAG: ComEC family competence protein [Rhodospirillaceae bacterium]|nr:ComEC family competence protein [Rhodospirillaceae bacterium]MBT6534753.1 ComEC family competence protein [Rhodospirillaceae bacterium]MBT7362186.1 ComEC family competence protein [Rhodospirillaceae bacterium]
MLRAMTSAAFVRAPSGLRDGLWSAFVAERDRWVLWLPVALGIGIWVYFALPREPVWFAGPILLAVSVAGLVALGRGTSLRLMMVLTLFAAMGFSAAQWRAHSAAAPVLDEAQVTTVVTGRVVSVEPAARGPRVILDHVRFSGTGAAVPERVRVRLRVIDDAVRPGDQLRVRARLSPPPDASYPGGYDFSRVAWFRGIGAVGFALAPADISPGVSSEGLVAGFRSMIERARVGIATRIADGIDGPAGGVAAALATGQRGGIPEDVRDDMRDSGLAHLLAISGLHLGLVAGFVFALVRGGLALWPRAALGWPLKKIAAVTALAAAAVYLMLAGATIPTQRAFVMTAIVLVAILVNRTGISLRLVAWAALIILLLRPEALLSVSFQMSFAAVIALVAAYEGLAGRFRRVAATSPWTRRVLMYFAAIAFSSLIASLATAPFAVFHFNRFAPMGLAANLLAVPITALWVMPLEVLALLLMPLGLEGIVLPALGWGVEAVLWIARTVAAWPGAAITVAQPTMAGMILAASGGLWLCLWRRGWRYAGISLIVAGLATAGGDDPPDILVSGNANLIAIRSDTGATYLSNPQASPFVRDIWQRRLGVPAFTPFGAVGLNCDAVGCSEQLAGHVVAVVENARGFEEECRRADILISTEPIPRSCRGPNGPAVTIGRFDVWRSGAHAVWLSDENQPITVWRARERDPGRPWMRATQQPKRNAGN